MTGVGITVHAMTVVITTGQDYWNGGLSFCLCYLIVVAFPVLLQSSYLPTHLHIHNSSYIYDYWLVFKYSSRCFIVTLYCRWIPRLSEITIDCH